MQHQSSYDSRQISARIAGEPGVPRQSGDHGRLARAEFQHRGAVGRQQAGEVGDQAAIGRVPVRATIERRPRLIASHLRHQAVELRGGDIGRVAQDQVEASVQRGGPVGAQEGGAVRHAQHGGIARGEGGGGKRAVHSDTEGGGEFGQGGEQQASGAGAKVEHTAGRIVAGKYREGRLDQCLGVRARDQGGGRNGEIEAPEFASADDQCERLMRSAPGNKGLEGGGIDRAGGIAQQGGRRGAERVCQQQPCVETWIVDAGLVQARGGLVERILSGEGRADPAPCYAAWLAARFARVRSSRRFRALASTVRRRSGVPSR